MKLKRLAGPGDADGEGLHGVVRAEEPVAISGLDRLVQYAQDFAVEPSRAPRRSERVEGPRPSRENADDGIKLSLSSAAYGSAPAEEASQASSTPVTYGPRENTAAAPTTTPRTGSAVAAYQRPGAAELGQRIAIRA